ncbi:MAG: hypothetical protein U1E76_25875, partial [Planctomycetota bacterium]
MVQLQLMLRACAGRAERVGRNQAVPSCQRRISSLQQSTRVPCCAATKEESMRILIALAAWFATVAVTLAQDAVKIAPDVYKVTFENDQVRVLEVTLKAGGKVPQHSHPANVVYGLSDGKARFTDKDGKSTDVDMKVGQATWNEAQTHSSENAGTKELKALVVELKDRKDQAPAAEAAKGDDPVKVASESYKVLLDNDRVRVLDIRLQKGGKVPLHSHPGYLVYALNAAKVRFTGADGKPAEIETKAGQSLWRDAEAHAVENLGGEVHVLNFE